MAPLTPATGTGTEEVVSVGLPIAAARPEQRTVPSASRAQLYPVPTPTCVAATWQVPASHNCDGWDGQSVSAAQPGWQALAAQTDPEAHVVGVAGTQVPLWHVPTSVNVVPEQVGEPPQATVGYEQTPTVQVP